MQFQQVVCPIIHIPYKKNQHILVQGYLQKKNHQYSQRLFRIIPTIHSFLCQTVLGIRTIYYLTNPILYHYLLQFVYF